jgi:hypothetical protein
VFTARYALSPYIKQTSFVFKGLRGPTEYAFFSSPPSFTWRRKQSQLPKRCDFNILIVWTMDKVQKPIITRKSSSRWRLPTHKVWISSDLKHLHTYVTDDLKGGDVRGLHSLVKRQSLLASGELTEHYTTETYVYWPKAMVKCGIRRLYGE